MNITCSICDELFVPTDDVYVTPCGHVFHFVCVTQWLERASTCPQCRAELTTSMIHKAFFNCTDNENPELDSGLMSLIGNLNEEILLKDTLLKTCEVDDERMKDQVAELRAEIERLQVDIVKHKSLNHTYEEQIKHLEDLKVKLDTAKTEVTGLTKKVREYENMETLINRSRDEMDRILNEMQDKPPLLTHICGMRREMESNVQRYEESQERIKRLESDISHLKLERDNLLKHSQIVSASASRSTELQRQSIESVEKQRSQSSDEQRNNAQLNPTMEQNNAHSELVGQLVEQLVKHFNINTKTPKFDENRDAMDFIRDVERYFEAVEIRPEQQMILIESFLEGKLRNWYELSKHDISNYQMFKEKYIQEFCSISVNLKERKSRYTRNNNGNSNSYNNEAQVEPCMENQISSSQNFYPVSVVATKLRGRGIPNQRFNYRRRQYRNRRPTNPPPNPPSSYNSNNQPSSFAIEMPDTRFPPPNMVRADQSQNAASLG